MKRFLPFFIFFILSVPVLGGQEQQDPIPVDKLEEKADGIIATITGQKMAVEQVREDAYSEGNAEQDECLAAVLAGFDTLLFDGYEVRERLPAELDDDTTVAARSYTMLVALKERADGLENNARYCALGGGTMTDVDEFSESMQVTASVNLVERRLGHIINHRMRELSGGNVKLPGSVEKALDALSLLFWNTVDSIRGK